MTSRSSAREMVPRIAMWTCGASRFWGSMAAKYWMSKPQNRRRFWMNRSNSAAKCSASRAAVVVVVGVRVGGCSVLADPAVGRAGQRDEQRGAERLAVRRGVGLAGGAGADRAAGQRRGVLPAPGRAVAARPVGEHGAAHPGVGDLLVQLADPLVQVGDVEAFAGEGVAVGLGLGAVGDLGPLLFGGRVRVDDGFVVEVPAFAALRGAQQPGPFGAGRADRGQGVPAGDEDLLDVAGVDVGAA